MYICDGLFQCACVCLSLCMRVILIFFPSLPRSLPFQKTQSLLTSDELANVPFLVLGNKIDVARAVSEEQLRYALGLQNTYGKDSSGGGEKQPGVRPIELYMCSVIKRMGYADGFKWLAQFL